MCKQKCKDSPSHLHAQELPFFIPDTYTIDFKGLMKMLLFYSSERLCYTSVLHAQKYKLFVSWNLINSCQLPTYFSKMPTRFMTICSIYSNVNLNKRAFRDGFRVINVTSVDPKRSRELHVDCANCNI